MTEELFRKLEKGDHVKLKTGQIGAVQWFGLFNGKRWVRSTRMRANGAWLWIGDKDEGYVSRTLMESYVPAPLFGTEAKTVTPEGTKQPWQMTQKEWIDGHIKSPGMHRESVRLALSEGKPVPPEVLKNYPELVQGSVRGEQAGMLGVPGKTHTQQKAWTPGQIDFDSYAKYVEAKGTPSVSEFTLKRKARVAYKWFQENERGMGTWAGIRQRVYDYTIKGLSPADVGKIPYSQRETPPMDWNLPPEYMVAYFRNRGMEEAQALAKVEKEYLPSLSEAEAGMSLKSAIDYDRQYSLGELRQKCKDKGLSTSGDKKTLAKRLLAE